MKKAILMAMVMLATAKANALHCTLNAENPSKKNTYDQTLVPMTEVLKNGAKSQVAIVKRTGEVIENLDLSSIHTIDELKALDQAKWFSVSKSENGAVALAIGVFDVSNSENMFQSSSLSFGQPGKLLMVVDYRNRMALTCVQF